MLTIREPQLSALGLVYLRREQLAMAAYLRDYFGTVFEALDEASLQARIAEACREASHYGISSRAGTRRFLNLCALHGWHFLRVPEHRWMKERYLEHPDIPDPDVRIELLVAECVRRLEVAAQNARSMCELRDRVATSPWDEALTATDPDTGTSTLLLSKDEENDA